MNDYQSTRNGYGRFYKTASIVLRCVWFEAFVWACQSVRDGSFRGFSDVTDFLGLLKLGSSFLCRQSGLCRGSCFECL